MARFQLKQRDQIGFNGTAPSVVLFFLAFNGGSPKHLLVPLNKFSSSNIANTINTNKLNQFFNHKQTIQPAAAVAKINLHLSGTVAVKQHSLVKSSTDWWGPPSVAGEPLRPWSVWSVPLCQWDSHSPGGWGKNSLSFTKFKCGGKPKNRPLTNQV